MNDSWNLIKLTTDVVPSPTSWSCNSAKSTRILAAGCSISNNLRIVAPSFVIVTSFEIQFYQENDSSIQDTCEKLTPISSTSILSKPNGPNELLTIFDKDIAAITINYKNKILRQIQSVAIM